MTIVPNRIISPGIEFCHSLLVFCGKQEIEGERGRVQEISHSIVLKRREKGRDGDELGKKKLPIAAANRHDERTKSN